MEYKRKFRQLNEETKNKISHALKGKRKSPSHVEKIKKGLKKYWENIPNKAQ